VKGKKSQEKLENILSEKENGTYQNLCYSAKAMLRG
jgi:hypothetical protein